MTEKEYVDKHTIYKVLTGSRLYGTDNKDSDIDMRGVCIVGKKYYFGFFETFEQYEDKEDDTVIFNIKKVLSLMANCNPNMFDLLFAPREFWQQTSVYWEEIWKNREMFISKKAKSSFCGYANDQLKRIGTHRKWLFDPPDHQPTREEFGLKKKPTIREDLIRTVLSFPSEYIVEELREDVVKEQAYQKALQTWRHYNKWKKERNPARAALEARIGYDAKHGMHLTRLLRMGREILVNGEVLPDRRKIDAEELKQIRNCEWPYEKMMEEVRRLEDDLDRLRKTSTIPEEVDEKKVNDLCIEVTDMYWKDLG